MRTHVQSIVRTVKIGSNKFIRWISHVLVRSFMELTLIEALIGNIYEESCSLKFTLGY